MTRSWLAAAATALACGATCKTANGGLTLDVDPNSGKYDIGFDGSQSWATALSSNVYAVRANGKTYSTVDGSLKLSGQANAISGSDQFGQYSGYSLSFGPLLTANFYLYDSLTVAPNASAIVFEQVFPTGLAGCSNGNPGDVVSAFPVLGPSQQQLNTPLNWWTFSGLSGASYAGQWTNSGIDGGKFGGGSGNAMVALMNASMASVVFSALTDHLTAYPSIAGTAGNALTIGFNGRMAAVPANYSFKSILVAGQGLNDTMHAWGDALLLQGGKQRTSLTQDLSTAYLSWWNDNGAYYYHHTENGKNYEQTIKDQQAYIQTLNLPVRAIQFDSWWYYERESDGALMLWEPMPSVFPDLMTPWPGIPLVLHNRYFADHNNYTAMNKWDFLQEDGSPLSLPQDKDFFLYIMGKAKAWGAIVYEQDWLYRVFQQMNGPSTNITVAHTWLHAMGDAASELNMTVQYCLPEPRHIIASTAIPAVTHARASEDYQVGTGNSYIMLPSLLYSAVGIQPFKDVFWSTVDQPGAGWPYSPQLHEPDTDLQLIISTLSTGPVAPGDGIPYANASLIMTCCRPGDGLILKPDRPAFTLDSVFASLFPSSENYQGVKKQGSLRSSSSSANSAAVSSTGDFNIPNVASTYSTQGYQLGNPMRWHYVYSMSLAAPFTINFADIGPSFGVTSYAVADYFNLMGGAVATLDAAMPFVLQTGQGNPWAPKDAITVRYYILAPVIPENGWVLLGEVGKVTTVSSLRVSEFVSEPTGFGATVTSMAAETITFAVIPPSGSPAAASMVTNDAGVSTVVCTMPGGKHIATLACKTTGGCSCA